MGVHGLWRLIEPSGKPVPLETLENKVLAVDVSIWLHQAVKGFQDSKGAPVPNAHLLGIYHRVCKLLYFKIKPIFVFDGGVPVLKKETIAKRNQSQLRQVTEAERLQKQLISTLLKHSAISKVLSEKTKASLTVPVPKKSSKYENMYALPTPELDSTISSSEDEDMESTDTTDSSPTKQWDIHTIDMSSTHFKSLPVDVRHEILTELKETRKQNSWGRLHELPKQSDDFSCYQMNRLLKRQAVQSALDDAEKEMGGHSLSLAELESILKDHGVVTTNDIGKRIASDENTRYLYIKDIKQALEEARQKESKLQSIQEEEEEASNEADATSDMKNKTKADIEFEEDLEKAIALSLQEKPSTSKTGEVSSSNGGANELLCSYLENFNDADFESDASDDVQIVSVKEKFSSAQSYMMEYSGLTPNEINKILSDKKLVASDVKGKRVVEKRSKVTIEGSRATIEGSKATIGESKSTIEGTKATIEVSKVTTEMSKATIEVSKATVDTTDLSKVDSTKLETRENEDYVSSSSTSEKITSISESKDETKEKTSNEVTIASAESTKTDDVDLLSDNDSSSNDEFEEVSEETIVENKNSFEIVIDPSHKLEDDDLFSDVFNKNEVQEAEIIQEEPKLNTDVLCEEKEKEVSTTNTEKLEIETSEVATKPKENVSVVEESKIPVEAEKTYIVVEPTKNVSEQKSVDLEAQKLKLEELKKLQNELQSEKIDILVEKSVKERMANNITDQMYQEAQDLLELFGVPYVVAPMEAEAQCAFLDAIELTDGTITDDSDIWLFGGRTVYKNFFNQSKYVMEFKSENIKHHFKLTREQMILLALLVGSDYTVGLQGVGPVTALEILAAFPPSQPKEFSLSHAELLSGLKEFRSWFNKGKTAGPGRVALKNKLKNLFFTDNFPSLQVVQAYLDPTVETSKEKFSWSKPDFVALREFAREKFGWAPIKAEEILKPVIKKVEESQAQKNIKDYFKTVFKADSTDVKDQMSKRVQSAINRMGKSPEELIAEEMEALKKEKQKKSRSRKKESDSKNVSKQTKVEDKPKRPRKKKSEDTSTSEENLRKTAMSIEEEPPKEKKPRSRSKKDTKSDTGTITTLESSEKLEENSEDLKKYENIAMELKMRRQKRNELSKKDDTLPKKKPKPQPQKTLPIEVVPENLEDDEEIQLLKATTSRSLKRTEEIDKEIQQELNQELKKQRVPNFHKKDEIIHQKLRDRSDLLRNKLKAIEVFRKSKKGPGYMPKRGKAKNLPKEDAELSENSSDE